LVVLDLLFDLSLLEPLRFDHFVPGLRLLIPLCVAIHADLQRISYLSQRAALNLSQKYQLTAIGALSAKKPASANETAFKMMAERGDFRKGDWVVVNNEVVRTFDNASDAAMFAFTLELDPDNPIYYDHFGISADASSCFDFNAIDGLS
jgi:hypothetical protein